MNQIKPEKYNFKKYKKLVSDGKTLLCLPSHLIIRETWNTWFAEIDELANRGLIEEFWAVAQQSLSSREQELFGFTLHEYLMDPTPKRPLSKKGSLILLPVLMLKKDALRWGSVHDREVLVDKICDGFRGEGWLLEESARNRVWPSASIWKIESWLGISLLSKYRLRSLEGRWQYLEDAVTDLDLEKEAKDMVESASEVWMSGVLPVYVQWTKREWVERMEKRAQPSEVMDWYTLLKKPGLWIGRPGLFHADALVTSTAAVLKHLSNERGYLDAIWNQEGLDDEGDHCKVTYKVQYKKSTDIKRNEIWTSRASFWIEGLLRNQIGPDGMERMLALLNKNHEFM